MNIENLISQYEQLKSKRTAFDSVYTDINKFFTPHRGTYIIDETPGTMTDARTIHPSCLDVVEKLASRIDTDLTNLALNKLNITVTDDKIGSIDSIRVFADTVSNKMREVFVSSASGWQQQNVMSTFDIVSLGTGCITVEETDKYPFVRFKAKHISRLYVTESYEGMIDGVYEYMKVSLRNLLQKFELNQLSEQLRDKATSNNINDDVEVLRVTIPSKDAELMCGYSEPDLYTEFYIEIKSKHIIESSPLSYLPYTVARYDVKTGEQYGRSPCWIALPIAKQLSTLSVMKNKALQMNLLPPVLTTDDGVLPKTRIKPGVLISGGIDEITGMDKIRPYRTADNLQVAVAEEQQHIARLMQIFYAQGLPDNKNVRMTEMEIQARLSELKSLAPTISRFQSEYLNEIAKKVYHILYRKGVFGEAPIELKDTRLKFNFMGSLTKIHKLSELEGLQQTYQFAAIAAQFDNSVLMNFDHNKAVRYFADIAGAPIPIIRPKEEVDAEKQAMAQQQQQLQNAQIAQMAGGTTADLIKARGGING